MIIQVNTFLAFNVDSDCYHIGYSFANLLGLSSMGRHLLSNISTQEKQGAEDCRSSALACLTVASGYAEAEGHGGVLVRFRVPNCIFNTKLLQILASFLLCFLLTGNCISYEYYSASHVCLSLSRSSLICFMPCKLHTTAAPPRPRCI